MWLLWAVAALSAVLIGPAMAANPDGVAVIVGNRGYQGRVPQVDYAHRDADAFHDHVVESLGFRPENIIDLRDAGQAQLFSVFGNANDHRGKLWSLVRPERSDVVVFYSGHGVPGQRDRRGYLLPVDADAETPEINGYALDTLYANLAKLRARQVAVFIDACFSGDSQAGTLIQSASPVHLRARPATVPPKLVVLTAAQSDQLASWDTKAGQGLFTRHLLAALGGAADRRPWGDGDGQVSLAETRAYLDDEMSYAARRLYRREQRASVTGPAEIVLAAVPAAPAPVANAAPAPAPAAKSVPKPTPPPRNDGRNEALFWESVRDSDNPADLEAYLARYPDGTFAVLARNRLAALQPVAAPRPAPAPQAAAPRPAPPAPAARLPGPDGHWATADGNTTLHVRGGTGEMLFFHGGSTWRATLTIQPDGTVTNGYVNFDAFSGVQFRGKVPNVTYEVFGTGFGKGVIRLQRRDPA
ncbi:MAG: caspase family protein [Alphaproteobacteria bacterium]